MYSHELVVPSHLLIGRVASDGKRDGRASHLVVRSSFDDGRLVRASGESLCGRSERLSQLLIYHLPVVVIADFCPRCLEVAILHHLLDGHDVTRAEAAFAATRVDQDQLRAPSNSQVTLPLWGELDGDPATLRSRGIAAAAIAARMSEAQPLPVNADMTVAWFRTHAPLVADGMVHRRPFVFRVPRPALLEDQVVVLADEAGAPLVVGIPVARLGADIVVLVSRFEVILKWHCPERYPGGEPLYRSELKRWHRYPHSQAQRTERWQWRRVFVRRLLNAGYPSSVIARWFFEQVSYIDRLMTEPVSAPSSQGVLS